MLRKIISSFPFIFKYYSGICTIFYLHRVKHIDLKKLSANENMKVTPEFLERFIIDLKSNGYEFISLDNLYEILIKEKKQKKKIIITLDDGYKPESV